jgi:hydrogenase maturation protease
MSGATVVIGVGNVLLSDDGLGVHAIRRLRDRYAFAGDVALVEGGTAGLLLLPHLADARRALIVDAIDTGAEPGALVQLDGDDCARAFTMGPTAHDVGLADLLGAARVSGAWPQKLVLHGAQPASAAVGTELTAPLAAVLDLLVDRIVEELVAWGVSPVSSSAVASRPQATCRAHPPG